MSSTDPPAKKREKERACDGCRRRKTKCDGPWMQQNICTNCIQTCKTCTYVENSKPRCPPKAYVTDLEDRLELLETLLQRVCPGMDFSEELGPPVIRGSWKAHLEPTITPKSLIGNPPITHKDVPPSKFFISPSLHTTHLTFPCSKGLPTNTGTAPTSCAGYLSDDDEMLITSFHGKRKFRLLANEHDVMSDESAISFDTKSCTAGLVEVTWKYKYMHIRETLKLDPSAPSSAQPRRPQFWRTPEWEFLDQSRSIDSPTLPNLLLFFPPIDLADTLFSLYFAKSNSVFPLLHRPTFERQWRDGLHHRNIWFACVCAFVLAVASRWCDDERVLPEGSKRENGELDWRKAGRQYFEVGVEIHRIRKNISQLASLFEVQSFTLMGMYLRGTNAFPAAWLVVSVGIRKAQDVGAHRKKIYRTDPNADDELWKRAFWHLVAYDRIGSVVLGRACGIAEEDFDLPLPLEVDDEYWEERRDTAKSFEQPPSIPSRIMGFNHLLKLTQIMAFTMRTMYAIDKGKNGGIVPMDKEDFVRQLSSAMEEWLKTVPEHLKWRDNMNSELFIQSATLFTAYYFTLMLIHRPLITSPSTTSHKPDSPEPPMLSEVNPAVVICTNAARSCARIIEVQLRDGLNNFHMPSFINVAYVCAGLLSYRIWNLKIQEKTQRCDSLQDVKLPTTQRIEDYMADAHMFMKALEQAKLRWDIVDSMLEELNASLPGAQSQDQGAPDPARSNYSSPKYGRHPCPSTHASHPMDIEPGQSPTEPWLKHNQYVPDFHLLSGIEQLTCLQLSLSQNISTHPPNANLSCLHSHNLEASHDQPHPVPISGRPRAFSAAARPPYIPDERPSNTAKLLRRTSFSNLHATESHDGQQHTGTKYPSSLLTPAASFSIGGSAVKYHDTSMWHLNDEGNHASMHLYNLHQSWAI